MSSDLEQLPPAARAAFERGTALHTRGDLAGALREYQSALPQAPHNETLLAALGKLAMEGHDFRASEQIFRALDARFPGRYLSSLALAVFNQQRYSEVLPLFERLSAGGNIDINCALAWAMALEKCDQIDRSIRIMIQIWEGTRSEKFAVLLMSALLRLGRQQELDEWMPKLIAAFPTNAQLLAGRSEHGFLSGDYATGFDYMHHRWSLTAEKPKNASLVCPRWDGNRFDGTLLVTAEQGLGDQVLVSSMFEDLVRLGQPALIDCDARLLPLYRRSFPSLRFADRKNNELVQASTDGSARWIDGLELGRIFRRNIKTMPTRKHWLVADPQQVAHWKNWLDTQFPGKKRIGISWRSARAMLGDSKSIPATDLEPLLKTFSCVSLQYGEIAADIDSLKSAGLSLAVAPSLDCTENIDGLCALIAALDAVATCSNTTAHLAAALGIPTRVMIPGSRYILWYWGHEGAQTPWYPEIRLFRGPPRRDWRSLAGDVRKDLASLLTDRTDSP